MSQEIMPSNRSHHLQAVIDCITERNNSPNKKNENHEDLNIDNLYGKAGNIIAELDTSINRCKKYNQAKINRKYEIIITDLQAEIKKLSEKLKLEQDARSPTKKHISDILDKLVIYRDQNTSMRKELDLKKQKIKQLQDKLQNQSFALLRMQNQMPKATIQRLPAISNSFNINQAVKQFLKDKELVKKITKKSTSALQKFLINHKTKMWNWTVANLLQELDKWGDGIKEKPEVDMWRIRSSIARKFSDMIDDSGSLTRANRLGSMGSQFSTGIQPKYYSNKKLSNFSYKGSKQQLNLNISAN